MMTEQEAKDFIDHDKKQTCTYCKRCKSDKVYLVLRADNEWRAVVKCRCSRMVAR